VNSNSKESNLKILGHSCEGRRCENSISIISLEKEKLTSLIKKGMQMRMYNHSKNHSNSIEDECMALESDQHQD
jgi:hypothetical protein